MRVVAFLGTCRKHDLEADVRRKGVVADCRRLGKFNITGTAIYT